MTNIYCTLVLLFGFVVSTSVSSRSRSSWTGAVYEHALKGDLPEVIPNSLQYYERAARLAKEEGAYLIVFPEYGIVPHGERNQMKKYLENIPNPKTDHVVPCNGNYSVKSPILHALSCMAKNNNIVVVANMGGIERCAGEPNCPEDGDRHLNANVAFDRNGTLVGRYYKERLYFEIGMDLPVGEQDPTFVTDFGKFAMFICFEIIFRKMADVSQLNDIEAILFSTMWINSSPFYNSIQWFEAWAMGNNATLLASNAHVPGYLAAGSGIFAGRRGSLVSMLKPDGISKLMIASIPPNNEVPSTSKIFALTENDTELLINNSTNLPFICSYDILGKAEDVNRDYRCLSENVSNYTLAKLNKTSDHLEICHNGMCCELDYSASTMDESFYFGVYNGTENPYSFNRYFWAEENCFLARCDDFNGTACGNFPMKSNTVFQKVIMRANVSGNRVYPSLVGSDVKLIPVSEWFYGYKQNKYTIEFNSSSYGVSLLMATLKSRAFDRDPPYIR